MVEFGWNLPRIREVCSRDPEEIWDDGLQALTTPMALNLKLLSDASLETVDAMMYRQMFCSLMFLMDPRHAHLVVKHAVRYLEGTIEYGLKYDMNQKTNCMVMLIQIGKAVPSIGRELQDVASVWDQV